MTTGLEIAYARHIDCHPSRVRTADQGSYALRFSKALTLPRFFRLMAEKAIFLRRVRVFQRGTPARPVARRTTFIRCSGFMDCISRDKRNFIAG